MNKCSVKQGILWVKTSTFLGYDVLGTLLEAGIGGHRPNSVLRWKEKRETAVQGYTLVRLIYIVLDA
jgi:hypothetical protein